MTEADWQKQVMDLARLYGWRVVHFRPARMANGEWRTPVEGDAAGWPDLTLVRAPELIFAELKAKRGRLSAAQQEWITELSGVAAGLGWVDVYVWKPDQFDEVHDRLRRPRQRVLGVA